MYFRFGCGLALVVAVSVLGVAIEKANIRLKSDLSRQYYLLGALRERHAQLRTRTQRLGAPARIVNAIDEGELEVREPAKSTDSAAGSETPQRPLLRWRRTTTDTL